MNLPLPAFLIDPVVVGEADLGPGDQEAAWRDVNRHDRGGLIGDRDLQKHVKEAVRPQPQRVARPDGPAVPMPHRHPGETLLSPAFLKLTELGRRVRREGDDVHLNDPYRRRGRRDRRLHDASVADTEDRSLGRIRIGHGESEYRDQAVVVQGANLAYGDAVARPPPAQVDDDVRAVHVEEQPQVQDGAVGNALHAGRADELPVSGELVVAGVGQTGGDDAVHEGPVGRREEAVHVVDQHGQGPVARTNQPFDVKIVRAVLAGWRTEHVLVHVDVDAGLQCIE